MHSTSFGTKNYLAVMFIKVFAEMACMYNSQNISSVEMNRDSKMLCIIE